MLSRLLRQFLFTLVHLVVSVLVAVQNVYLRIRTQYNDFSGGEEAANDVEVILRHIPYIIKKPKHLVILTDMTQHTLKDLALVVIWSLVAGVPYISFHDVTGELKENETKLFLEVEKCKKGVPGCIKWSNRPNLNGYTNGIQAHTITINVFTASDGRPKIAECIRKIANNELNCKRKTNEFTAQEFDEVLRQFYPSIPDPDLVMYTGSSCRTYGLLPWQIRLSEFVQLSLDQCINIQCYIGALYKYNKCDQRFGK
ncbi:unnamed protein product [Diatraea saccharalis]|uniref:ditrans,polycis-polyprenyl diphosphate synthase [(2E,6E)-farnesyldiphosphate specific] n=1 Tax=Diatraea saccharalis TaxID=40085 RepID=A0A9N9R1A2_9NEOP|nr:unnamed protein product [Diatraea saccharalis]